MSELPKMKRHEEERCVLCRSSIDDANRVGPKYKLDGLVAHYFCLLFACRLIEKGNEGEGILGFLKNDILIEVKRAKFLKCVFCKEFGAASGCCISKCKLSFHFPCGLDNDVLSQFKSPNYHSYCSEDRPIQKFSPFLSVCNCKLCSRPVNPELDPGGYTFIQAPCCGVIIHRNCLQREASIKSVDTFKCPSCEDPRGKFLPEMQDFGIYIPKVIFKNMTGVDGPHGVVIKSEECDLCSTDVHDELRLGPKFQLEELDVHYFCLLFAYGLTRGHDRRVGILGFEKEDIKEAIEQATERVCVFCNELGATSNCCQSDCQVSFHYPCGLENGVLSLFKDNQYDTYCLEHRPRQEGIDDLIKKTRGKCPICNRKLEPDPTGTKFLLASCCGRVFHRLCLQKRALITIKAKSTFKCPCHKNRPIFIREMLNYGLCIPGNQTYLVGRDESENGRVSSEEDENQEQDSPMDQSDDSTDDFSQYMNEESDMRQPPASTDPTQTNDADRRQNNPSSDSPGWTTPQIHQLSNSEVRSIGRDSDRVNDGAGPSWMDTSPNTVPKTEEDEEIQFLKMVENSREGSFQIAIQRARGMLSDAFVQLNGRVRVKICKLCGYFTLSMGPSSHDHERLQHRSLMRTDRNMFEEEEMGKEVTILMMARQILELS